ncbi:hypothetical protein RCL1_004160 [Eukaryota sp. TZLM3-RCL]
MENHTFSHRSPPPYRSPVASPNRKRFSSSNVPLSPPLQRNRIVSPHSSRPTSPCSNRSLSPPTFLASPRADHVLNSMFIKSRSSGSAPGTPIRISDRSDEHIDSPLVESDPVRINWRIKQIQIGKNTPEYKRYLEEVPVEERCSNHPTTPPLDLKVSKKKWGYIYNNWRRELHVFDPSGGSFDDIITVSDDDYPKSP